MDKSYLSNQDLCCMISDMQNQVKNLKLQLNDQKASITMASLSYQPEISKNHTYKNFMKTPAVFYETNKLNQHGLLFDSWRDNLNRNLDLIFPVFSDFLDFPSNFNLITTQEQLAVHQLILKSCTDNLVNSLQLKGTSAKEVFEDILAQCGGLEQSQLLNLIQQFLNSQDADSLATQTSLWGSITAAIERFEVDISQLLGAFMQVMAKSPSESLSTDFQLHLCTSLDKVPIPPSTQVMCSIHFESTQVQWIETSISNPIIVNLSQAGSDVCRKPTPNHQQGSQRRKSTILGMQTFSKRKPDPSFYEQEQKVVPNYITGRYEYTNPAYEHKQVIPGSLPSN
ncbi:hypothetical protein PPACK8108_LOCUS23319 [Phakopsora pachyrhizi]|uniref:Uncharacterized protein n=1 Tax=Phakopsora pachyrhizi TaxID=170000 RepID=A0AAV0BPT8_PHAPC|nr:hypothetical protein PPACK8108_LOCUS23319 [Phakopsora pachyrhizi]